MENQGLAALESLVVDNPDLERLEQLLSQFNVFEALGAVRHELRHSDFLGFLLDPQQNHGLGDEFARVLLQKILSFANKEQIPISLVDLDVWDLNEIEVRREWQNIDILLVDHIHKLVVIIENKIGTSEHSDQLQRYRQIVTHNFPNWNLINIFLTPDGVTPSDDSYIAADYMTVCLAVERLTEKRASTLGADVRTLMLHYAQMLRRHIVNESEIADLCRRIYRKHKLALDLIFEHRPDEIARVRDIIVGLINNEPSVKLDTESKTLVRFTATEWNVPLLLQGEGWTKSGQMLLFEIYIQQDAMNLVLYIGPGPIEVREAIFKMAQTETSVFRSQSKSLNRMYNSIYRKKILRAKDFDEEQAEDIEKKIKEVWEDFIQNDLPKIKDAVQRNQALWQVISA